MAARMEAELAEVEDEAQEREDRPAEGPNKKDMSRINKANARRNFQNALNNVSARPGGRAAQGGDDAFARRSTRPMNYWATSQAKKGAPCSISTGPVLPVWLNLGQGIAIEGREWLRAGWGAGPHTPGRAR